VTVRPGDSLWLIAARRLGVGATPRQIDAAWREWYAANQALIGADPNVIHPGQVLVDPGARSTSATSTEEAP
jgi:nucleoid-associated protein YgaU